MDMHKYGKDEQDYFGESKGLGGSSSKDARQAYVTDWLEIWDYVGGATFRGYVAEHQGERSFFVFFDSGVLGSDLKPGLMALLELCEIPDFDCSRLVVCLDRQADPEATKGLMRDLGWVGFEAITLADWTESDAIVSDRWMFLSMDA